MRVHSNRYAGKMPADFLSRGAELNNPEGARLIDLGAGECAAGQPENAWLLEPRYLRKSAAEEKWESRAPAASG
jgi:hypothetical protein